MSRSWPREGDSAPTERAQTEPLAALVAVLAVCLGLSMYALAVPATAPRESDRSVADPTLRRASAAVVSDGVADPDDLPDARSAAPDGYEVRVTLRTGNETWRAGPEPPADVEVASRPVSVRVGTGRVRPGRLTVEVWA